MLYLQMIYFCLLMLLVPLGVGTLLVDDESVFSPATYLSGLCTCFAAYEVIGLFFSMVLETSLTALTVCWGVPMLLLSILGWNRAVKKYRQGIKYHKSYTKTEKILLAAVVAIVSLQVLRAVTGLVTNNDDFMYCAQATTATYTDTINQYQPHTGKPTDPRQGYYYLALWPILWGSMSQVTSIHPAIIMRTLLPIFMIPSAYLATYLVLKEVFRGNREKALAATLLLIVAYEVMACNDGMKQWWLLLLSWFGKSVAPNLICPFLLYAFLRIEDAERKGTQKKLWVLLFIVCLAGCLAAVSCYPMIPFFLGVFGIAHWIRTRNTKNLFRLFCCTIPCTALFICSTFMKSY